MKLAVAKALRRISMVVLLCLIVVLSATACGQNDLDKSQNNDTTNNHTTNNYITNKDNNTEGNTPNGGSTSTDETDDFFASMEDMEQITTILNYYHKTENTVFLKLKITRIYDEVYIDKKDIAIQGASGLAMLECNVEKDLYGSGFDLNQSIIIPIFLNQCFVENDSPVYKDLNIEDVKAFLSETDYIYVTTRSYTNETFVVKNNSTTEIHTNLSPCNLSLYELLPSVDGKLSLNQLDTFFAEKHVENLPHSEIYGMDSFCPEGITCAMFEDNVKKLSEYYNIIPIPCPNKKI